MSRSWKVEVCRKKKNTGKDDKPAISSKGHVKYEAIQTYLSVTYQPDRLHLTGKGLQQRNQGPQQRSQGPQQQQSTLPIFPRNLLGEKKHQKNDAIPGRMHVTHWFLPWILPTYYDLPVAQLNNRRDYYFSLCFWCVKCIPFTLVHLSPCHKLCHRQKACV